MSEYKHTSDKDPGNEIALPPEELQPLMTEVERLMDGIASHEENIAELNMDDNLLKSRAARFPIRNGEGGELFITQTALADENITEVSTRKVNPDLTTARNIVHNFAKLHLTTDSKDKVYEYDYDEKHEVKSIRVAQKAVNAISAWDVLERTDSNITEVDDSIKAKMEDILRSRQGIEVLQPIFTAAKFDSLLATMKEVSINDREIEEGVEEPTLSI